MCIESSATRSGARDAARRMLQDLQQMLENLQMARPGQQMEGDGDDDMMSALDELGDMIRKQQQYFRESSLILATETIRV